MFHYQCTIIIFIAATKNHKIQTLSKSSSFMIHCIQFACAHSVSHTPQRQARTVLKTSTDNHPSSCHLHQLLRSSKTRDYQHLGILFHDVRAQMTKGVDHFGECFVQVRPINQLFSCKISNLWSNVRLIHILSFLFGLLLHHNTDYSTLALLPTWRCSDNHDVSARNHLGIQKGRAWGSGGCWSE